VKASQLINLRISRAVGSFTLPAGIVAAYVDQLEIIPAGKLMMVTFAAVRQSALTGAQDVALYLAPESLRAVSPVDPFLTSASTGPDLATGLVPLMNSQTQNAGVKPNQGYPVVVNRPIIIPNGFFMKGLIPASSADATAMKIYLDYMWYFIDQKCDIEIG
jgi:hypothetical protein